MVSGSLNSLKALYASWACPAPGMLLAPGIGKALAADDDEDDEDELPKPGIPPRPPAAAELDPDPELEDPPGEGKWTV